MSGSQIQSSNEQQIFENKIEPMWASTKVAAAILGISPNALRIRKCRGQIECRYFGSQLRFNMTYLQSLLRDTREERKE
jgi:hypothetical protein